MTGTIVAVITDTHIGSTVALAPPKFAVHTGRKDETQVVEYNRQQEWLYTAFQDFIASVRESAGIRGKHRRNRLIFLHLGDVVDGLHHGTVQVMNETGDQIEAACNLLRPLVAIADGGTWITYGTGAHNGGAAEHEVTIGRELGARHGWEFTLNIDGVVIDIAHHGRAGQRDWTGSAAAMAVEVARDYQKDGKPAPQFVLRGHVHRVDDTGWKLEDTRAITLPCWQLRTTHGYRVATNQKRAHIGGMIINTADADNPRLLRYTAPGGYIKVETI